MQVLMTHFRACLFIFQINIKFAQLWGLNIPNMLYKSAKEKIVKSYKYRLKTVITKNNMAFSKK